MHEAVHEVKSLQNLPTNRDERLQAWMMSIQLGQFGA